MASSARRIFTCFCYGIGVRTYVQSISRSLIKPGLHTPLMIGKIYHGLCVHSCLLHRQPAGSQIVPLRGLHLRVCVVKHNQMVCVRCGKTND